VLHVRRFQEKPGPVRIVDCEGISAPARAALFAAAAAGIDRSALEVWTESLAEDDRAALARLGFEGSKVVSAAKPFAAILVRRVRDDGRRPWTMGGRDMLQKASWNVRLLDSDAS
jgi:hypothetical protein